MTLAWDPIPDSSITGYHLYYGATSHDYTNMVTVGPAARVILSGLVEGTTYYFAVTAIDDLGLESAFSNEARYTVPRTHPTLQLGVKAGKQVSLRVAGQLGHTYEIQATEDFSHWKVIGMVTLDLSTSVEFTDATAAGRPLRFYRLREVTGPSLQLLLTPGKQVVLHLTGQPGHTYEIQATQNLTNWSVIGVVTLNSGASFNFTDGKATEHPMRFYRLREMPLPSLGILLSPEKQVVLRITGSAGQTYELQATDNLTNWNVVGSVTLPQGGSLDFTDHTAAGHPVRFYRLHEVVN